ncbi:GNAT family N-acetyltransferase [Salirhabdus sp. Marseille-P4669]|uniref:GNAT family N-acetyltransferase n=1 Tax=Salirhabdus sp. Marseille-P4669 TaxID=2042310 RepID=UPI000C7E1374|nr:GNAT family N-acetyltransferase [Salirhabdus sp. Marseille-P4669]
MTNGLMQVRQLTVEDLDSYLNMETGIEDDYVARIFDRLVISKEHVLYGLFEGETLLSVGGYSIFANHYAMLGRLRSDQRYLGKGHATRLMKQIIAEIETSSSIHWVGANTHVHNKAARKVLEKLNFTAYHPLYPLVLEQGKEVNGTPGPLWSKVESIEEKRELLLTYSNSTNNLFTYECYYPFPASEVLFHDSYLEKCHVFVNNDRSRFFLMKEDQKGELYALLEYPWDDSLEQPGLWETVNAQRKEIFTEHKLWMDLKENQIKQFTLCTDFDIKKPWLLHGKWVK